MSLNFVLNNTNNISVYNNQYQYNFLNGGIDVPDKSTVCINSLVIPYSFYNVTNFIGNNVFYYTFPVATNSYTVNATSSTTITVSGATGTNLQVGSIVPLSGNTATSNSGFIFITALGSGTGGNGTYTVNQTVTYSGFATSSTQTLTTITLQNGFYQISDIQNAIQTSLRANGYYFYNVNPYQNTNATLGTTNEQIIYPISLATSTVNYTNAFTFQYIPTSSANVINQFGYNFLFAGSTSNLPSTASTPQIIIPTGVTNTSTLFGNLLGYLSGSFPSAVATYSGSPTIINSYPVTVYGNSLTSYSPPFPALGSNVNAIVIRCSLVNNPASAVTDLLDVAPITSSFGSNIYYYPVNDTSVFIKKGKYSSMIFGFYDQNNNPLYMNDPNILLSVLVKLGG